MAFIQYHFGVARKNFNILKHDKRIQQVFASIFCKIHPQPTSHLILPIPWDISQGIYADTEAMMSEVFELNPVQGISYKSSQDGQDMCGELLADAGDGKRYEKKHEWMELEQYAETEWLNLAQLCSILLR